MQDQTLPENYKGYSTKDLLKVWEEIQRPGGTKAPREKILAMRALLKEFRLGVHAEMPPLPD